MSSIPTLAQLAALADVIVTKRGKAIAAWAAYRVVHDQVCALSPYEVMRTPYWMHLPCLPEDVRAKAMALDPALQALKRVAMAAGKDYRLAVEDEMDAFLRRENAIHGDCDSDSDTDSDSDSEDE